MAVCGQDESLGSTIVVFLGEEMGMDVEIGLRVGRDRLTPWLPESDSCLLAPVSWQCLAMVAG